MTKLEKLMGLKTPAAEKEIGEEEIKDISTVELAYRIAEAAHRNQKRVNGDYYFTHPLGMLDNYEKMLFSSNNPYKYEALMDHNIPVDGVREIILLHDVVEDTNLTHKDIKDMFAEYGYEAYYEVYIEEALKLLTHNKREKYETYIKKVMDNSVASLVKMLDLMNNANLFTLNTLGENEYERVLKYIHYFKMINDKWHYVEKINGYKADIR